MTEIEEPLGKQKAEEMVARLLQWAAKKGWFLNSRAKGQIGVKTRRRIVLRMRNAMKIFSNHSALLRLRQGASPQAFTWEAG